MDANAENLVPFGDRFVAFARRKGFAIVLDYHHDAPCAKLTWKSNKRIDSLRAYFRSSDGRFEIGLRQRSSNWLSRILYLYYQRDLGYEGMYRIGAGNWNDLEDLLNKLIDRLNTVALKKGGGPAF